MLFSDFAETIRSLGLFYRLSVVSWGRTEERNRLVEGHRYSWHLLWTAVDVVPDDPSVLEHLKETAGRLGLEVIDEGSHWHIEPRG